jgi:hypothetical protein
MVLQALSRASDRVASRSIAAKRFIGSPGTLAVMA